MVCVTRMSSQRSQTTHKRCRAKKKIGKWKNFHKVVRNFQSEEKRGDYEKWEIIDENGVTNEQKIKKLCTVEQRIYYVIAKIYYVLAKVSQNYHKIFTNCKTFT